MDNPQQSNSDLGKANKTFVLGKIKSVFFQHFEQAVDDCCMRIDLEFGVQLGKNREKLSKDHYIKLLEYLRSVRKELKKNFLLKLNDSFDNSYRRAANIPDEEIDFSKVSLSSDDAVKENHAVAQIINRCEHLFYEELTCLNKYLAISPGKHAIAYNQNPLFPAKLMRALVEVVKPLKLTTDGRIALYKTFEVNVFSQLGFIYSELSKCCEIPNLAPMYVVGEIKEEVKNHPVSVEQVSNEFALLQNKLVLWRESHSPSVYDLIPVTANAFYEHFEITNALQILQQFNDDSDPGAKVQLLKWRVFKKLEELSFSDKVKNLTQQDEDVLDLVALIFSEIKKDDLLQEPVKTAVLQLEIPLAAASLGRYSVFTKPNNPVRQLLDDVYSAGQFLNRDEHDDLLIQLRIASAVKKMSQDSGFDISGWMAEAAEFSSYMNKQKQRSQNIEDNIRQLLRDQQTLELSKKVVFTAIENSMKGKALPTAIVEFLRNVWSEVLLTAYTDKNDQPAQWGKSLQAMDELIVSVMPPTDDLARKQLLKLLPGLIAELRKGLKQIAYAKSAQSRFFKDLAVWHIILMDKKDIKKAPGETVKGKVYEKIKSTEIADEYLEQASNIAVQSWLVFSSEPVKQWAKLIWGDASGAMVFVGKNGVKMFEIQADELAKKLQLGHAALIKIDQKTITERVLSKLMSL